MNIIATTVLVGAISALPAGSLPDISNPVDGLSVSAAGIEMAFTGEGFETGAAKTADFQLELRFKSHAPIRVRL